MIKGVDTIFLFFDVSQLLEIVQRTPDNKIRHVQISIDFFSSAVF